MQFAVMVWVGPQVKPESIFGVVDKVKPGQLPILSPDGRWEPFRIIDETRFVDAVEASQAITGKGYYLIGAGVPIDDAFGPARTMLR